MKPLRQWPRPLMIQLRHEWVGPTSALQPRMLESVPHHPPVIRVQGGASTSTMTATVEELSKDVLDGRDRDVPSRAITAPARDPLATGTEIGGGTGGSEGGCGGPEGGGGGNDGPGGGTGQAAGGLGIDLEVVIWATISASGTAAMAREANIPRAAVEARSDR